VSLLLTIHFTIRRRMRPIVPGTMRILPQPTNSSFGMVMLILTLTNTLTVKLILIFIFTPKTPRPLTTTKNPVLSALASLISLIIMVLVLQHTLGLSIKRPMVRILTLLLT